MISACHCVSLVGHFSGSFPQLTSFYVFLNWPLSKGHLAGNTNKEWSGIYYTRFFQMTVAGTKLMKDFMAMKTLASSRVPADSLAQVCT